MCKKKNKTDKTFTGGGLYQIDLIKFKDWIFLIVKKIMKIIECNESLFSFYELNMVYFPTIIFLGILFIFVIFLAELFFLLFNKILISENMP